jgi:hypothetical protein
MSNTKLNAKELSEKRYPEIDEPELTAHFQDGCKAGYFFAIEEVAQPIADHRDELRKSLSDLCAAFITHLIIERDIEHGNVPDIQTIEETAKFVNKCLERACLVIAKYPNR